MATNQEKDRPREREKKGVQGKTLFFIIISCWLLLFLYMGAQGGG